MRYVFRFFVWSLVVVAVLGGALAALLAYFVYTPAPEVRSSRAR